MQFDYFLSLISKIENAQPGGSTSHNKMIPRERKMIDHDDIKSANARKAAVLALFYPDRHNQTRFLLILRPAYDGTHSSQIGFPGGKFELADEDLARTALRETYEEVGIDPERINISRKLTDTFIPPSNFLVSPFIGYTHQVPEFNMNWEVEEIIEVKLMDLLNDISVSTKKMSTSYMKNIDVPCYLLNNKTVWGATAMMLSEIKDLIKANLH